MENNFTVTVLGEIFEYKISPFEEDGEKLYRLTCPKINENDVFDAEDLMNYISSEDFKIFLKEEWQKQKKYKNRRLQIRVNEREQNLIEKKAIKNGFKNTSEFMRSLALKA